MLTRTDRDDGVLRGSCHQLFLVAAFIVVGDEDHVGLGRLADQALAMGQLRWSAIKTALGLETASSLAFVSHVAPEPELPHQKV